MSLSLLLLSCCCLVAVLLLSCCCLVVVLLLCGPSLAASDQYIDLYTLIPTVTANHICMDMTTHACT